MKNRAKCKLCGSVIESFHDTDYVVCECGHISVDGGESMRCAALDFSNFIRLDDDGNEITVKILENTGQTKDQEKKLSRNELIDVLEEMTKSIERMPAGAMTAPVTHYDHYALLLLLVSILRDWAEEN